MFRTRTLVALALAAPFFASPVHAQTPGGEIPGRTVTLQAGGFMYDYGGDRTSPMAALRVDWPLSRYLRAEVGGSYARTEVSVWNHAVDPATVRDAGSSLTSATVGLQAELPLRYVRPYVGAGIGLFGRFDPPAGDRFILTVQEFPVGVRIPLGDRLGVRGELRARFDQHQGGGASADLEQTVGVTWRF